mgnify:CR=1 FL=1
MLKIFYLIFIVDKIIKALDDKNNFTHLLSNGTGGNAFVRKNINKSDTDNLNLMKYSCFHYRSSPHVTTFDKLELENLKATRDRNNFINFEKKKLKKNKLFETIDDKFSLKNFNSNSNEISLKNKRKNKSENPYVNKVEVGKPDM